MKKFSIFLLLSFMFASPAMAGKWVYGKVTSIVGVANGGINVAMGVTFTNCVSQSGYGPHYASLLPTHPGKDKISSLVLAAYMSDKPISIYLGDTDCTIVEVDFGSVRNSSY